MYRARTRARDEVRAVATTTRAHRRRSGRSFVRVGASIRRRCVRAMDAPTRAFDVAREAVDDACEIRRARWRRASVRARVDRGDDGG